MFIEGEVPQVVTGGNNSGSGFGFGNNDAWVLIILFALIFGWGRNGNNDSNGSSGAVDNYVLATDFATIERKIDGVNSGLCDGFYAMNTGMLNGFAGVTNAITTGGYDTRSAIAGLSSQLADCCCTTQRSIDAVNYNMATNTCAITNAINTSARDIIDSQNANYRALHDEIVANRIEDKNAQIAAQQSEINKLQLAASQSAQNAYLINTLRPTAIPAYITCSPYQSVYGCGTCSNTCGSVV